MSMLRELTTLSAEAWQRTRGRLDGLTDEEYFWEPVSGCWSIRKDSAGSWVADGGIQRVDPAPFTTIGWRLWHLIDMYGENRAPTWLGVPPQGEPIGLDDPAGAPPGSAADALDALDRAHARWEAHLALATDELLADQLGSIAGPFGESSKAAYVLHMLDEYIHHGAELALLRDLWFWQQQPGTHERHG